MAIFKSTGARPEPGKDAQGISSPGERPKGRVRRAAYVQPRLLLAGMVMILAGSTWWAAAQGTDAKSGAAGAKAEAGKPMSLAELPALMAAYGQRRAALAQSRFGKGKSGNGTRGVSSVGAHLYSLTEVDLTPNSPSDERYPAFSPNGDYIAFSSDGVDTNQDGFLDAKNSTGKYHIWIMLRNGRAQRQVTGFGADAGRDQTMPAWSPDGNTLVYVDQDPLNSANSQLFIARPFDGSPAPIEQRTFFPGTKSRPSWNSSGQSIAFASTVDPAGPSTPELSSIFTISPTGSISTAVRVTGGPGDPVGQTTSDTNPSFSRVNQDVIFFSSDREFVAGTGERKLTSGRRIWMVNTNTDARRQVTDPARRYVGPSAQDQAVAAAVVDDFPATSSASGAFTERIAFQSNSLLDASDRSADINVWSVSVNTGALANRPDPALLFSNYNSNSVQAYSTTDGSLVDTLVERAAGGNLNRPSGITFTETRDFQGNLTMTSTFVGDGTSDYIVANREAANGYGEVNVFDGRTNSLFGNASAAGGGLTHPTGVAYGPPGTNNFGESIYVASGAPDLTAPAVNQALKSSNKVHRFRLSSDPRILGSALPSTPKGGTAARAGSEFTTGDKVTNGIEGIAFGPDLTNDGAPELFVSAVSDNKIVVYDGLYGTIVPAFPEGFVLPGADGPIRPTGLTFGPDSNLYVVSSGDNRVLVYDGTTGAFIKSALAPTAQAPNDALGIAFGPDGDIYIGSSAQIKRYDGTDGTNKPVTTTVPPRTGANFSASTNSKGYLTFNPSAYDVLLDTTGPVENISTRASLESNLTSSSSSFAATGLTAPGVEDRVADREPAFGYSSTTLTNIAQLAFASQRNAAAIPNGDVNSPTPNAPIVVNPVPTDGSANDHDIWTTASQDFTPPTLVPQGTGNDLTPFIAPGVQSPFFAPRTAEAGLRAGGQIKIAFVLKEQESGLNANSVTVLFKNAEKPTYVEQYEFVNEAIPIRAMVEDQPTITNSIGVNVYDDGPPSQGGHELQAGATKNDGIYYCSVTTTAPALAGDYYIDVYAQDRQFNSFNYDNVWGFSTRSFQKANNLPDLLVSDYTVGQEFPETLRLDEDWRFQDMTPVESYYLTNPGDAVSKDTGGALNASRKTTFTSVNVWRILCRGPVPSQVYDAFTPTVVNQFNPTDFENGRPAGFPSLATGATGTLPEKSQKVVVSKTGIIWATPYTGLVFAGPGTLLDPVTQTNLTNYLDQGGRLFVSGRDVIFALTNQGTLQNNFLKNELQASWSEEELPYDRTIDAAEGYFSYLPYDKYFKELQFPYNELDVTDPTKRTKTYTDAAWNQDYFDNFKWIFYSPQDHSTPIGFDYIGAGSGGTNTKVIPSYTTEGKTVGQRVEKTRANGLQSRVVFFSFGFEGVNRRYQLADIPAGFPLCLDVRPRVADEVLKYFKTGTISGTVTDSSTNLPIPNFIVTAVSGDKKYVAVTNSAGYYEIVGVEPVYPNAYTVKPGTYQSGGVAKPLNPGYQTSTVYFPGVQGGFNYPGQDFRMVPVPQGALSGKAVVTTGLGSTATSVMQNGIVLLRSVSESSIFPGGGKYAQLVRADAGGRFAFANVPPDVPMELVFNPDKADIPVNTGLQTNYAGPNPEYGKRIIPDKLRPAQITAPGGESFILNDLQNALVNPTQTIAADTTVDDGLPIIVPFGVTVSGYVVNSINGVETPISGAAVTLTAPASEGGAVYSATTDAKGLYIFYDVPPLLDPLEYTLKVDAGSGKTETLQLPVRRSAGYIVPTIKFFRQDVTGVANITTSTGDKPAEGATITLTHPTNGTNLTTVTDANGKYKFDNVASDATAYTVFGELDGSTDTKTITVTDGQAAVVNILKLKKRGIFATVKLNGTAVAGATVSITSPAGAAPDTTTDSSGLARFGVPAGNYTVRATYGEDSASVNTTVPADGSVSVEINLVLQSITGRVTLEQDNATPVATSGAQVYAVRQSDSKMYGPVTSDAAGKFTIANLPLGKYDVRAEKSGDVTPATTVTIATRNGAAANAGDLVLRLRKISGTVTANGTPTSGAKVELFKGTTLVTSTTSGAGGAYSINGIAAGTYTLRASLSASVSPDVSVTFNRVTNPAPVELKLQIVNVSGRVTVNGVATGGIAVTLSKAGSPDVSTTTMADGSYGFGQVGAGNYRVTATTGSGGDTQFRDFTVTTSSNVVVPDIALLLQTVRGTVTVAGDVAGGITVELFKSGVSTGRTTTTAANGTYSFAKTPAGSYTVTATATGNKKTSTAVTVTRTGGNFDVPTINFQVISGLVTLNGSPVSDGVTVYIYQGTSSAGTKKDTVTPDGSGRYRSIGDYSGTYTAQAVRGGDKVERTVTVNANGGSVDLPLTTTGPTPVPTPTAPPTPTPSPTPTPDPATEDYQVGRLYEISIPYSDDSGAYTTTTVAKAFPLLPKETVNGTSVQNYTLRRFDALTQTYVQLDNGSDIIKRGEGYFLRPLTRAFSMRKPTTDATRIPTAVTEFQITLRRNPSIDPRIANNGYNLIGFPFDPANYSKVSWLNASVSLPDGRTFPTVNDAYNAGVMSRELTTLKSDNSETYEEVENLQKFKGYFVKTYVDGLVVTLKNPQP